MKIRTVLLIYFLFSHALVGVVYYPYFMRPAPASGSYPTFVHQYPLDYYLYLSSINQGKIGDWLLPPTYTTEPESKPGIFYLYYILVGKIARVFHLWVPVAYHVGKLFSLEVYLAGLLLLSFGMFGRVRGLAGALIALVVTVPSASVFGRPIEFLFTPWWYSFNALERLDNLPHHMFGQGVLLLSTYFFVAFLKSRKLKHAVWSGISTFVHGVLFPPTVLVYGLGIPVIFAARRIFSVRVSPHLLILPFLSACLALLFIKWQESYGFPWNQWTPWEFTRWNRGEPLFNRDLFFLFGILPLLSLPAVIEGFRRKNLQYIFITVWGFAPFFLLPFADLLMLPKIRLVHAAAFVPLSLLTTQSFFILGKPLHTKWKVIVISLFITANLAISYQQYRIKINYFSRNPDGAFSGEHLEAFSFLDANFPRKAAILSYEYDGIAIPAFTRQIVYFGQLNQTKDFFTKKEKVISFFNGGMNNDEALSFLEKNGIAAVYFGPHEREIAGGDELSYPFLQKVFENGKVTLFRPR